jgi:hypothetical protein
MRLPLVGRLVESRAYDPAPGPIATPEEAEDVWFRAADGTHLHGWFLPARTAAAGAVLMTHGNDGNVRLHVEHVRFLPDRGFHVLLFDYRGYGQSERGRLDRRLLQRDARAALDTLLARPEVRAPRVALWAHSLGSAFGLHLMREREEIAGAVVLGALCSWRYMGAWHLPGRPPGRLSRLAAHLLMPPGLAPIDALGSIRTRPVLLVHGTADPIVPFENAERLMAAAGPNVRLRPVPGGGHVQLHERDPALEEEIVAFLRDVCAEPVG